MPTNKLWLEHTERAAWDSVQALRKKLLAAEERLKRLAPLKENTQIQGLLDGLDRLAEKWGIDGGQYAEVLARLEERLRSVEAERATLESELAHKRSVTTATFEASDGEASRFDAGAAITIGEEGAVGASGTPTLEEIAGAFTARNAERRLPPRVTRKHITKALSALQLRLEALDDLSDAAGPLICDEALTLGALSMRLALLCGRLEQDVEAPRLVDDEP